MLNGIMIVGEAWGREEADACAPFVGASGRFLTAMLSQVGIRRDECYLTNVLNFQPRGSHPDNDLKNVCGRKEEGVLGFPPLAQGKYLRAEFRPELDRLFTEIKNEKPTLIIALGATAAWALTGTSGIKKVRGAPAVLNGPALRSVGVPVKVFPTYHPAAVIREYTLRPIMIADLHKARAESLFPDLRRPRREIWIEPTLSDIYDFESRFIDPAPDLSVDIETGREQITCIGFASSVDRALVVPFVDPMRSDGNYWPTLEQELEAWSAVRRILSKKKRILFQNGLYDIHYLWRRYGIPVPFATNDTMLLHHALQPEMEKGLGFLASVYTQELPWKFMRTRSKDATLKREDE